MIFWLACTTPDKPADTGPAEAIDDTGATPEGDDTAPPGETAEPVDLPALVINELMPKNDSTVNDPDGGTADWVELYNADDEAVDLSTVSLVDTSEVVWTGTGTLEPGERLLLWADDSKEPDGTHLPFALSSEGETLELSVDGQVVDTVETGAMIGDVAWARHPDGGDWAATIDATPDAANNAEPSASLDPSSVLFSAEAVHDIYLQVPEDERDTLDDVGNPVVVGSITFQGVTLEGVGIRLKGSGSYRNLDGKCAFKVDMNETVPGQRMRSQKGLTFNNANHDATWTHEYLTYGLSREAGYPAPRVGFANVHLNGELFGLYIHLEDFDDFFLERWFDDHEQVYLWEGGKDDWSVAHTPDYELEEGPDEGEGLLDEPGGERMLTAQTDEAWWDTWSDVIDMEAFATLNAIESLTLNVDGYQHVHNFYVYRDADGRWGWLTAGADYSWTSVYYGPYEGEGNHFQHFLGNADWKALYDDQLVAAAALIESWDAVSRFDALGELLQPSIDADPRKEHNPLAIQSSRESTRHYLETWPAEMVEATKIGN